jgi:hypothetical protein
MVGRGANSRTNWWQRLKLKASQAVIDREAAFVRGKIAGVTVTDRAGKVLVEPGHRIDEAIISRARRAGKMGALASAVWKAQTQDLKEKVGTQYSRTNRKREEYYLNSVEEFREARTYLRRILTMDVTDIRGNVVVASGKALDDEDIRRARDAGLLSALLVAAQQALPPRDEAPAPTPPPYPQYSAPRPAPTLLATPDDEESEQGRGTKRASRR